MKLNNWYRIGILISVIWLILSNYLYFQGISRYTYKPTNYNNIVNHNYYEWVPYTHGMKQEELKKLPDLQNQDGFPLLKPTFKILGYLAFVLIPFLVLWVIAVVGRLIVRRVYAGYKT